MTEGFLELLSCVSRDVLPTPAVYASKNSGPYRCPREYRGGTAAGVRSNTPNTTRLSALVSREARELLHRALPVTAWRPRHSRRLSRSADVPPPVRSAQSRALPLAGMLITQYLRRDLLTRRLPGPAEGSSPCCAALLQGGSAPDAVRHGLKSVGQAAHADGAKTADRLRRFGLPRRRACCHRDGKEQPGIRLPAGAARHPAQGARSGRYRQHGEPPAGPRRRQRRPGGEPRTGGWPSRGLNACNTWNTSAPPVTRQNWPPGSGAVQHSNHNPTQAILAIRDCLFRTTERPLALPVARRRESRTRWSRTPRSVRETAFNPERAGPSPSGSLVLAPAARRARRAHARARVTGW